MPNQITRDIYVTKDALKNSIHYVRGTDLIPIVMRFCDFSIPSGATARIFVGKPDGNAVYTSATIEGNTVTIDVTEQMFVTLGLALMQVSIMDGDEELVTFAQPVMVEPNLKAGDFPESSTDVTFLDDAIEQANEAVETATTAAQQAATAVQNANTAISKANSAIADVNEAVASMNANFANLAQVATINALQTTAKTVVGAINELNSNIGRIGKNTITNADLFVYAKSCAEGITVFRTNNTVTNSPVGYTEGYIIKMDNNITIACFNMSTTEMFLTQKQASSENFLPWKKSLLQESIGNNAGGHNSVFRGKNLGSSVSSSQWSAIQNASFDDIFVGDYWVIGGVNWRVAALDYFYNTGDTALTKHHAVIVPDTQLYTANMNDTNTTEGAYVNSKMRTENLEQAKTTIKNAFGASHVLSHRLYLSNATANGRASAGEWYDADVEIMTEHMVYGNGVFSPVSDGSSIPNNYRIEKSQLPLFVFRPDLISKRQWYWLRDVISSANFAYVNGDGNANYIFASNVNGVRPYFLIG